MSTIGRRKALSVIGGTAIAGIAGCLGDEEDYPTDDIAIIVPYGPGGGVDAYAQGYGPALGEYFDVNIEIDHIEGAAGLRGLGQLIGADSDGYTIGIASPPAEALPALIEDPGFDQRELTGVALAGVSSLTGIINVDYGIESYSELVDAYQEGELEQVGGLGEGGQQHAAALTARELHGLDFDTYVAYGGTGAAEEAVLGDEVPFAYGTDAGFASAVNADAAYPVAIASEERSGVFPDWPTVEEEGFEDMSFVGNLNRLFMAPPELPDDIQQTLESAFEEIHESEEVQEWGESTGNDVDFEDGATAEAILSDTFDEIPEVVDMDELAGQN